MVFIWDMRNMDDNLKYLHKIIQFCEDKQIQLILVTTPTCHSYYEHLDKHQLDQLLSIAKELDNNHENVFYFNFLKDDRFNDNDFKDGDHLSEEGAEKFTKILKDSIRHKLDVKL